MLVLIVAFVFFNLLSMYSHFIVGVTDVSHSVPNTVVFTRAFGAKVQNPAQETSGKSERFVFSPSWKILSRD